MISSLTQQLQKTKLDCQPSKPEVESAELPLMAAILDPPKAPEPCSLPQSSVDREREMARRREQERRRREAVSTSHTKYLDIQLKMLKYFIQIVIRIFYESKNCPFVCFDY